MDVRRWSLALGCVVGVWTVGCQSEADEAAGRDAEGASDVGASDASSADAAVVDAFVCSCTDPVDGVCTVHPLNADDGWVLETLPDGTECERREGPFFCNNGCGAPGVADLWYDAVMERYVLFGVPPCVTDTEPDRWRHVRTSDDGTREAAEEAAIIERFIKAPECPVD